MFECTFAINTYKQNWIVRRRHTYTSKPIDTRIAMYRLLSLASFPLSDLYICITLLNTNGSKYWTLKGTSASQYIICGAVPPNLTQFQLNLTINPYLIFLCNCHISSWNNSVKQTERVLFGCFLILFCCNQYYFAQT